MGEIERKNKFKKLFCYIAFLVAFLCVGFINENDRVEAKHVIEISDKIDYENR